MNNQVRWDNLKKLVKHWPAYELHQWKAWYHFFHIAWNQPLIDTRGNIYFLIFSGSSSWISPPVSFMEDIARSGRNFILKKISHWKSIQLYFFYKKYWNLTWLVRLTLLYLNKKIDLKPSFCVFVYISLANGIYSKWKNRK